MTQKIVIRTLIVLFGLIAVSVVGSLIFVGDGNPTEELHAAATEFGAQPTEYRLRRLLQIESDGEYSLLKMALISQAFAEQPTIFRSVAASPLTPMEQECINNLGRLGALVFDYDESLKPTSFDAALRSATWLKSKEAQQAASSSH
jgi:hypothetical protein